MPVWDRVFLSGAVQQFVVPGSTWRSLSSPLYPIVLSHLKLKWFRDLKVLQEQVIFFNCSTHLQIWKEKFLSMMDSEVKLGSTYFTGKVFQ